MSKFEERAFPVGKAKSDLASLKNQLARLKDDLDRFIARKPDGAVIAPLRERIKELEAEIAEADQRVKEAQLNRAKSAEGADESAGMRSTTGRYPSHRR